MPKKKMDTNEQLVSLSRPQRNPKAKIVFDPSDVHIPKKRKKRSEKCMNGSIIRKSGSSKKNYVSFTIKNKSTPANELLDPSLNETVSASLSSENSLSNSPTRYGTPEIFQEEITICCICAKDTLNKEVESVNCPICMIKAHSDCLVVNEPMWRFKIDQCPWFCNSCRDKYCSKCHKVESQLDTFYRCITCNVSLHVKCYESYDIKPLHKLKSKMYVCIPCMTLATQRVPEVEDEEVFETHAFSVSSSISDNDDDGRISIKSYCSSISQNNENKYSDVSNHPVPDVSKWDKHQIFQYLSDRGLPETVTEKIINNDLDGHALLLLQRSDITSDMGLKLGPALKLYKEVRILQTKSTNFSSYWE